MITPNNKLDIKEKLISTSDPVKKDNDHKNPDHKTADGKPLTSQQGFKGLSNHDNKCDTNKDMKK